METMIVRETTFNAFSERHLGAFALQDKLGCG